MESRDCPSWTTRTTWWGSCPAVTWYVRWLGRDADIGSDVVEAIAALGEENFEDLCVEVDDGVVTLSGIARSLVNEEHRRRHRIEGSRSVGGRRSSRFRAGRRQTETRSESL